MENLAPIPSEKSIRMINHFIIASVNMINKYKICDSLIYTLALGSKSRQRYKDLNKRLIKSRMFFKS